MIRMKSGLQASILFTLGYTGYVASIGPTIQDNYIRYALAGTSATILTEFYLHGIDTLNMRSKVSYGTSINFFALFKFKELMALCRGIQAVIYGYALSSMVYFWIYAKLKDAFRSYHILKDEEITLWQTMYSSFISSTIAEMLALCFYYPFDLIKTRMQTK